MRVLVSEFMSLDGVVQAPGGAEEDTSGGFRHGGWSMQFFDPEIMGPVIGDFRAGNTTYNNTFAVLDGRRQLDAFQFTLSVLVEQAQLDLGGVGGEECEIDP